MNRNVHPVEELFEIRAEIRALKEREAELRSFFISRAGAPDRIGPFHQVLVSRQSAHVLDRAQLPSAILTDPAHWCRRETDLVKVVRRPEDPHCSGFAASLPPMWSPALAAPDDPLFEPYM